MLSGAYGRAVGFAGQSDLKHIVLVAATTGYQVRAFDDAARRLGIRLTLATDRCHVLEDPWADRAVPVRFEDVEQSAKRIPQCDGILAVADQPTILAARAAELQGIPFHSVEATRACHDKRLTRERLRGAGLPSPESVLVQVSETNCPLPFPCVLKPLHLSGSRGVIRVDSAAEYNAARLRIGRMIRDEHILVEQFLPGAEFALEGVMTRGELQTFTLFEKPDPLDGPFFEESIYLTFCETKPIREAVVAAVLALGLSHGPVHAEVRVNAEGVFVLEVAARPIGGLCAGVLRFQGGASLEEVLLLHASGEDVTGFVLEQESAGVMMIPIGSGGVLQSVSGVEEALGVAGITGCVITAKLGHAVVPLPEGASYLGFLFAREKSRGKVLLALRRGHNLLRFRFLSLLPVV